MDKKSGSRSWLLLALFIVAGLFAVYYFFAPLLGIGLALTAGGFAVIMSTLGLLFLFILLIPLLAGIAFFIIGLLVCIWFIVAISLFPIFLPIFIPVIVLLLLIKLITRNKKKPEPSSSSEEK